MKNSQTNNVGEQKRSLITEVEIKTEERYPETFLTEYGQKKKLVTWKYDLKKFDPQGRLNK